jgi:hypothetical protein
MSPEAQQVLTAAAAGVFDAIPAPSSFNAVPEAVAALRACQLAVTALEPHARIRPDLTSKSLAHLAEYQQRLAAAYISAGSPGTGLIYLASVGVTDPAVLQPLKMAQKQQQQARMAEREVAAMSMPTQPAPAPLMSVPAPAPELAAAPTSRPHVQTTPTIVAAPTEAPAEDEEISEASLVAA